jgi:hypothetical protein
MSIFLSLPRRFETWLHLHWQIVITPPLLFVSRADMHEHIWSTDFSPVQLTSVSDLLLDYRLLPISSWSRTPWGSWQKYFFLQRNPHGHSPYVTSSLTRGRVLLWIGVFKKRPKWEHVGYIRCLNDLTASYARNFVPRTCEVPFSFHKWFCHPECCCLMLNFVSKCENTCRNLVFLWVERFRLRPELGISSRKERK